MRPGPSGSVDRKRGRSNDERYVASRKGNRRTCPMGTCEARRGQARCPGLAANLEPARPLQVRAPAAAAAPSPSQCLGVGTHSLLWIFSDSEYFVKLLRLGNQGRSSARTVLYELHLAVVWVALQRRRTMRHTIRDCMSVGARLRFTTSGGINDEHP